MGKEDPLLSIVTVNFNGRPYLKDLLDSVKKLDYPSSKVQMIMVDNGSSDGSAEYVREGYPWVEVVKLTRNLGYAGGNNEGFKRARGAYIALINNDCILDRGWARGMLDVFDPAQGQKIGAVGPKVLFYYPYLLLQFEAGNRVGISCISIGGSACRDDDIKFLKGFHPGPKADGRPSYWCRGRAVLALPVYDIKKDMKVEARLSAYGEPASLKIGAGKYPIEELEAFEGEKTLQISVPASLYGQAKDIINSCGVKVNRSFYARERGYLAVDEGQYSETEEVFGLSGTSFLADRRMFEDIGAFDQSFFTYYEDIDLFWRARLKGWRCFYTPDALARHHHCGTGSEWSYSFTYHVLRNRILMIFKCGWPSLFFRAWLAFTASMALSLAYGARCLVKGKKPDRIDIPIRVKLFFTFFFLFVPYIKKRFNIRGAAAVPDSQIKKWIRDF